MIEACIFDLDGVVVDTAKYHFQAWKRLADQLGFTFTEEHNERLKGVSRMRSLEILLDVGKVALSGNEKEKFAKLKNEWYKELINQMKPGEVLPGAIEFISAVKQQGIKTALGSASKNAQTILENTQITHLFDVVIDGTKTQTAKPDPEVFLLGAKELGVSPEKCVVFEDAEAGIQAALNAGMDCIGIGDPAILKDAHRVVAGLHELNVEQLKML